MTPGYPTMTTCPQEACGLPSEVLDRFVMESTDGPVEHVKVRCLGGHFFCTPLYLLAPAAAAA